MKYITHTICAIALALFVGCGTSQPQSKFTADTVTTIKVGMAKTDVTGLLGEPRSRSTDSDGNEVWQYRKNGQEGKGMKTFADVTSFGLTRNTDAEYQDILSVVFKEGVVAKATYQENVHNLSGLENHN